MVTTATAHQPLSSVDSSEIPCAPDGVSIVLSDETVVFWLFLSTKKSPRDATYRLWLLCVRIHLVSLMLEPLNFLVLHGSLKAVNRNRTRIDEPRIGERLGHVATDR